MYIALESDNARLMPTLGSPRYWGERSGMTANSGNDQRSIMKADECAGFALRGKPAGRQGEQAKAQPCVQPTTLRYTPRCG